MDKLDPKDLRQAFASYMTGVTVVTACGEDGAKLGFTANSFTSVSLDPPLLLVCPGKHLSSIDAFRNCRHFAVNILAEGQENISNIFAGSKGDRFADIVWKLDENGVPVINAVSASFSCSTHQCLEAGDHLILIGEVKSYVRSELPGLGYWKGGYFSFSKERLVSEVSASAKMTVVGAILEREGSIYVEEVAGKFQLPKLSLNEQYGARSALSGYLDSLGLHSTIGRVYSIYDDPKNKTRYMYFRVNLMSGATIGKGKFRPIETLKHARWIHEPEAVMMARFQAEKSNNSFGLYIGDSNAGEIHMDEHSQE